MTTKEEIHSLLRFLAQDAKLGLAGAMGTVKALQEANLTSPTAIAAAPLSKLSAIFAEEKQAKQVHNAAKRASPSGSSRGSNNKKRPSTSEPGSPAKRTKPSSSAELEASLSLPSPPETITTADLENTVLFTNRAPLFLTFATVALRYTHPHQPLSSRLSLAQAVVSANSRSKAASLGILRAGEMGVKEESAWTKGQPVIRVLGREIPVLRRLEEDEEGEGGEDGQNLRDSKEGIHQTSSTTRETPLWGLDLEALRATNSPLAPSAGSNLPIYRPEAARAYLLRAFASVEQHEEENENPKKKKKSAKALAEEKESNLALLLRALEMLFDSWTTSTLTTDTDEKPFYGLGRDELDRRAWSWYVAVRPDVESGVRGWGGKGPVSLGEILKLRRSC